MLKQTQSIARALLYAALVALPFQSIWLRIAEAHGVAGKPFFLMSDWYEILILIFFAVTIVSLLFRARHISIKLSKLDAIFLSLYILALLSFFWSNHTLGYHIIGLRYSMLGVYIYFLTRLAYPEEPKIQEILVYVFWGVVIVGILQILLWIFLKDSPFLASLGMQQIHKIIVIPQVYGSLPGPNQFGSFLVHCLVFAYFTTIIPKRNWFMALALGLLILTFSRSALIALIVAIVLYFLYSPKKTASIYSLVGITFFALLVWFGLTKLFGGEIRDIFTHGASYSGHVNAIHIAIDRYLHDGGVWNLLFGYGAGEAGPATFVRTQSFIPESWYLQILYEYGILGLLLIITAFCLTVREAIRVKHHLIWVGLTAMIVNSLFLHVFSDNPAVTALTFSVIALLATHPILIARSQT
jgi:Ca2+/Na+ antiporter